MTSERETWIDVWKGILIFLVVFGHVIGGLRAFVNDQSFAVLNQAYTVVYLFHMPAFFVLAGILRVRRGGDSVKFGRFVGAKARRLLVPYLVWGLVSALAYLVLSGWSGLATEGAGHGFYVGLQDSSSWWKPLVSLLHAGGWPSGEGFRCNGVLWFLPCFFVVQLMVELAVASVRGLRLRPCLEIGMLALVAVLSWSLGWLFCHRQLSGWPWCLDRVPWFLAFEMVGCIMGSLSRLTVKISSWRLWTVGFFCFIGLAWHYPDLGFLRKSPVWYGIHVGLAMVGVILSMEFARLVLCRQTVVRIFEWFGSASLGIMLIHKFPVLAVQSCYRWLVPDECWWGAFGLAVLLAVGVTLCSAWCVNVIGRWAPWSFGK